jgi:hypothetical protein
MCAVASDTLVGPSVYCFGARKVIWRIQANSGTCSTFTVQVSNNDSTWRLAEGGSNNTDAESDLTVGDSLNTGGVLMTLFSSGPVVGRIDGGIPYRYARLFVRRRIGWSTATASASPSVACRTRCDSLRWNSSVVWSSP